MGSYFRFEDTFGSCLLFDRLAKCCSNVSLYEYCHVVKSGLGCNGCFDISASHARKLSLSGIDRVVCVFDLDNAVDTTTVVGREFLSNEMNKFVEILRGNGYEGSIEFVPTIFAAETVALIQFVDKLSGYMPDLVIGRVSINATLRYFVLMCAELRKEKLVKNFNNFFNETDFLAGLEKCKTLWCNSRYLDMACNPKVRGYSVEETLAWRDTAEKVVNSVRDIDVRFKFGS